MDDGVAVLRLCKLFDVALGDIAGLGLGSPRLERCVPARGLHQGRGYEGQDHSHGILPQWFKA